MKARRAVALAAFLASATARAQTATPPTPDGPTAEATVTARRLFAEGVEAAQASRWEEARERFARALEIRPAPILRFNLALACQNVGRLVEATNLYEGFLRETPAPGDPARVAAARQQVSALAPRLARLRVEATGDDVRAFRLDGRAQPHAMLGVDVPVDPGPHTVDVEGAAGDRQRREGAVYEGESMRVVVELSRAPAIAPGAPAHDWSARSQPFGHWVARPGPGGRWIDWAARASAAPRSRWAERPWTVALQLGAGAPTGVVSASARYFPQPWFGVEAALGAFGAFGPAAALTAHVRFPGARHAMGLMTGLGASLARFTLSCGAGACADAPAKDVDAVALSLHFGVTSEWRLGERFALRASAGLRLLTNPADLRASGNGAAYNQCDPHAPVGIDGSPCGVWRNGTSDSALNAYLAVDFGYTF